MTSLGAAFPEQIKETIRTLLLLKEKDHVLTAAYVLNAIDRALDTIRDQDVVEMLRSSAELVEIQEGFAVMRAGANLVMPPKEES